MAWNYRSGKTKYSNKKVQYDNFTFGSKLEASVYTILKARENNGEIEFLQAQARVKLTRAEIVYIPDFKCKDLATGKEFFVEAKGFVTPEFNIKKRLWHFYGPGDLVIYKGSHLRPYVDEIIKVVDETTERNAK